MCRSPRFFAETRSRNSGRSSGLRSVVHQNRSIFRLDHEHCICVVNGSNEPTRFFRHRGGISCESASRRHIRRRLCIVERLHGGTSLPNSSAGILANRTVTHLQDFMTTQMFPDAIKSRMMMFVQILETTSVVTALATSAGLTTHFDECSRPPFVPAETAPTTSSSSHNNQKSLHDFSIFGIGVIFSSVLPLFCLCLSCISLLGHDIGRHRKMI